MKKLLLLFLLSSSTVYAQRNFTIDETVFGPSKFAPKTIFGVQWTKNTDTFTHLDATY